jgi:hypothetical protein
MGHVLNILKCDNTLTGLAHEFLVGRPAALFLLLAHMENVFALLRRDHARLRAYTDPESLVGGGRDAAMRHLARQWAVHFLSEENFLFPRLADELEVRPLLRRLSETHALVREDFRELLASGKLSASADDSKAEELRDTVRKTLELEEESLFSKAEKIIPPEEAEALARDVEEFREELRITLDASA